MFVNLFASILAVLMVSLAAVGLYTESPQPLAASILVVALPLISALYAQRRARVIVAAARSPHPLGNPRVRLARLRLQILALSLLSFGILLFATGWSTVVRYSIPPQIPGLVTILTLAPFLLTVVAGTVQVSAFESATLSPTIPSVRQRLLTELRPSLLPVTPYLILSAIVDASWFVPDLQVTVATQPAWGVLLSLLMMLGIFLFSPFLLSGLFPSRPLEAGPTRDRFELLAKKAGVGLRGIRIWDTGGKRIVNACIAGPVSFTRFVFLTDALLEELPPDELDAVFAHELGHAKYHHFVVLFGAILAFLFGLQWVEVMWTGSTWALTLLTLVFAFFYFRVGFGALSRQLERQADFFSAELLENWMPTARALERVGLLSGNPSRKGWRHPPIPERVVFVARCSEEPAYRNLYFANMRRTLASVFCAFLIGTLALAAFLNHELARPGHERALDGAELLIATVADDMNRPAGDDTRNQRLLKDAERMLLESLSGLHQQRRASPRERRILENLAFVYEYLGEWSKATGVRSLLVLRHGFPLDWNAITSGGHESEESS